MLRLSQNRKIAITAVSLFIVSFSVMLFFLKTDGNTHDALKTNVLHSAEEAVVEEVDVEAKYRAEMEGAGGSIFVINAEGVFNFASEDFCELLEVKCEKLTGKQFINYVNNNDHSTFLSAYTKLIQDGEKIDAVGPFRMKSGDKEKLILFTAQPILEKKKVTEIIFSAKDLTGQVDEMTEKENSETPKWMEYLYPKIKEMNDHDKDRLMVDKISYVEK